MRIALFNSFQPFVKGGAEVLVDDLQAQLSLRGHEITLFRIPFPDNYGIPLLEAAFSVMNLNFDAYDLLIAFKFPVFYACHKRKVIWLFHQFRQIYDLFGKEHGIADDDFGKALKCVIANMDTKEIGGAHKVFANAEETAGRLKQHNGLDCRVLNPPLLDEKRYYKGKTGDYIYYPSRITDLKRQHLAIEAMAYVKTNVKLIISGKCNGPDYYARLVKIIKDNRLQDRVTLENKWISDKEKINLIADCLAVLYVPYKEDSCGFVTMEGFYASKPVISCMDSGGTKEFINDGENGFLTEPAPQALAECFDRLYTSKALAKEMGVNALHTITDKNINWDETIGRLLCE